MFSPPEALQKVSNSHGISGNEAEKVAYASVGGGE